MKSWRLRASLMLLQQILGAVRSTHWRLAYRARGEENLDVADGALNLPNDRASHGIRRLGRSSLLAARLTTRPISYASGRG